MGMWIGRNRKARVTYGFDEIALVPGEVTINPNEVDTTFLIPRRDAEPLKLRIPILASAMDGVTDVAFAIEMGRLGGLAVLNLEGVQTRYKFPQEALSQVLEADKNEVTSLLQKLYQEPVQEELIGMAAGAGSGTVFGHELNPTAAVVGAVNASNPGTVETYSAYGPGDIYYDANGTAEPTPLSAGQPTFLAPDGIAIDVPGFENPFYGTSAAAAEAAGVEALLLQLDPNLSPATILAALAATANAAGLSGAAAQIGAGLIDTDTAAQFLVAGSAVVNGTTVYNGTAASHDSLQSWTQGNGNFLTNAAWSNGGPTALSYVTIGDDFGTLAAGYTVTLASTAGTIDTLLVGNATSIAAGLTLAAAGHLAVAAGATIGRAGTVTVAGALAITGRLALDDDAGNTADLTVQPNGIVSADTLDLQGGILAIAKTGAVDITGALLVGASGSILVAGTLLLGGALTSQAGDSIVVASGGTLSTTGLPDVTAQTRGTITLDYGGTLRLPATGSALVGSRFGFTGPLSTYIDRAPGDGTDLHAHVVYSGLTYDARETLSYNTANGVLALLNDSGATIANLHFDTVQNFGTQSFALANAAGAPEINIACYRAGTRIATPTGESPIETLSIGDSILTASGETRPIHWIGHRRYSAATCAANPRLQPIRIAPGALGPNQPRRPLEISPQHALLLRDAQGPMLVPARLLVNGTTIARSTDTNPVAYFHIEVTTHDALLADGQPAETFLDQNSRATFDNADEYPHPNPPPHPPILLRPPHRIRPPPRRPPRPPRPHPKPPRRPHRPRRYRHDRRLGLGS